MKRAVWIFVFLIGLLLFPMFRQRSPISNRFVTGALGLDREQSVWTVSAQLLTDEKKVVHLSGETVADAVSRSVEKMGQGLELRQNKWVCIGQSTAETYRLSAVTDYLVRTGNGRLTADVVICRGSATDALKTIPTEQAAALIERASVLGKSIRSRLLDVCRSLADTGDTVIPIIRIENERAVMDGAALFVDGKWMTELSAEQTIGLSLLRDDAEACTVTVGAFTAELYDLSRSFKVRSEGDGWTIAVQLTAHASVQELPGGSAIDAAAIAKSVENSVSAGLQATARAYGSDACGLWNSIKKQMPFTASLSDSERKQHLQNSEYQVSVSVKITETGLR